MQNHSVVVKKGKDRLQTYFTSCYLWRFDDTYAKARAEPERFGGGGCNFELG